MNERGVEVLVAAGLNGVKQCKGVLRTADGAMCAGGVLLDALGVTWRPWCGSAEQLAPEGWGSLSSYRDALKIYGMTDKEWDRMVTMNNWDGLDFIGIARKLGPDAA